MPPAKMARARISGRALRVRDIFSVMPSNAQLRVSFRLHVKPHLVHKDCDARIIVGHDNRNQSKVSAHTQAITFRIMASGIAVVVSNMP